LLNQLKPDGSVLHTTEQSLKLQLIYTYLVTRQGSATETTTILGLCASSSFGTIEMSSKQLTISDFMVKKIEIVILFSAS